MSVHWGGRGAGHVSRWSASTSGVPSLVLDFLASTSLDSRITFTRGSTATFTGSNGLIQSAAINAPRFDYDPMTLAPKGLLIEQQRANLLVRSEQFENLSWVQANTTITANAITSPDGTTTADLITKNTARYGNVTQVILGSGSIAFSAFVKDDTSGQVIIRIAAGTNVGGAGNTQAVYRFTFSTKTLAYVEGGTATSTFVQEFPNGWFRVGIAVTTSTYGEAAIYPRWNDATVCSIYAWGAQLEAGLFPTSYIPTVASQVTRLADTATMTGTNFSSWYNPTEGTFVTSADTGGAPPVAAFALMASDGTSNERIQSLFEPSTASATVIDGNVVQANFTGSFTANQPCKSAIAYKLNDSAASFNGVAATTDTSVTIPTVDRLSIGSSWDALGFFLNGHVRQISYYNTRLLNTQLQTLSQ